MTTPTKHIGVLYSGGLDSAALIGSLLEQKYTVWPIYIACGLRWEKQEFRRSRKFLRAIAQRRLRPMTKVRLLLENAYRKNWSQTGKTPSAASNDREVFLPARNLLLITKALLFLSSKKIYRLALATLKGNPFPDGKKAYFHSLQNLLTKSFLQPIHILTPFRHRTKQVVIRQYRKWPLHLSLSCINPKGNRHCGRCNKCAERQRAFRLAGVLDKTSYKTPAKS